MANYYKIRKSWDGGKWTPEQKGAYSAKVVAIENCTEELIQQGYKVFDYDGNIVYPHHPLAAQMVKDGVTTDLEYWSRVFYSGEPIRADYGQTLLQRYSDLLNDNKPYMPDYVTAITELRTVVHNDIEMLHIPVNKFRVKYFNDAKKKLGNSNDVAFNLGYFAGYKEDGKYFTLPVGNLVADLDSDSNVGISEKYLLERKIVDHKLHFSANKNTSPEFRNKQVSTLIINANGNVSVEQRNEVDSNAICYAVSGAPIIRHGEYVNDYLTEGWDTSIARPTTHGFLGIKGEHLFYFSMITKTANCITSGEVFDAVKDFGFDDVIKVDGGGSYYYKDINGKTLATTENRHINNAGVVTK